MDELQGIHIRHDRAGFCYPQAQYFRGDERHYFGVSPDYRKILRDNLRDAMRARGWSIKRPPKVPYLAGVKRGEYVSQRSIQNMTEPNGPSPSLDLLAAVAVALGLQPWELLVPGMSIADRPVLANESTVEAEVARRVGGRMQSLQGRVEALFEDEEGPSGTPDSGTHRQAPGRGEDVGS